SAVRTPQTTPTCSRSPPLLHVSPLTFTFRVSDGSRRNVPVLVVPSGITVTSTGTEPHENAGPVTAATGLGLPIGGAAGDGPHAARLMTRSTVARRRITTPGPERGKGPQSPTTALRTRQIPVRSSGKIWRWHGPCSHFPRPTCTFTSPAPCATRR